VFQILSDFNKKDYGVVLTPQKTAKYIISRLGEIKKDQKILDPCVGPGIFIKELLNAGVDSKQIFTYDINSEFKNELDKLNIRFEALDTLLSLYPDSYNYYDFIIGNPPYLNKSSTYVRNNREKLKKIYGEINAHETYSMFIVNSIWRLKEGGKLGFITSDSFLTLSTHTKLRKYILSTCKIKEILLPPRNLFDNQNVSTSPAILILEKCSSKDNSKNRLENVMKIIPRVETEEDYQNPKRVYEFKQKRYHLLPFKLFFTDIEEEVINLFEHSSKLEEHIKGYIGMHTHNNLKYIAAVDGTSLAKIFRKRNNKTTDSDKRHKIISEKDLDSIKWKPYLKRGGAEQYYRPILEGLDWNPESIPIYDIPNNVPFEKEGIVISGVSSRLAVRYMPEGCYWDSNKAIGFKVIDKKISIEYALGLLNSSLYNYLAKGIINNTSSIQITGIHALPYLSPDRETKEKVEQLVKKIIEKKRGNLNFVYINEQKVIDDLIFNFYARKFNLSDNLKEKLDMKYSIYKEKI